MREFKFRGWDDEKMLTAQDLSQSRYYWSWLGKQDVVLMQYVGIKDKNGKEIYEGDIVKYDALDIGVVKWVRRICGFEIDCLSVGRIVLYEGNTYEILGNIYENPELLEAK